MNISVVPGKTRDPKTALSSLIKPAANILRALEARVLTDQNGWGKKINKAKADNQFPGKLNKTSVVGLNEEKRPPIKF